jgi:hypothetical protein
MPRRKKQDIIFVKQDCPENIHFPPYQKISSIQDSPKLGSTKINNPEPKVLPSHASNIDKEHSIQCIQAGEASHHIGGLGQSANQVDPSQVDTSITKSGNDSFEIEIDFSAETDPFHDDWAFW